MTVYRWVQRFTPELINAARPCRHVPGDRGFVDETYVKVAGRQCYLYRALNQHGQVVDVLVRVRGVRRVVLWLDVAERRLELRGKGLPSVTS
jgi:transposase-like protein